MLRAFVDVATEQINVIVSIIQASSTGFSSLAMGMEYGLGGELNAVDTMERAVELMRGAIESHPGSSSGREYVVIPEGQAAAPVYVRQAVASGAEEEMAEEPTYSSE
ncbi:MAG: hypothetical protein PHN45_08785, partial [Methylococcales bacterium]|nr:hypothetical protein [Methylococcales bacterium]